MSRSGSLACGQLGSPGLGLQWWPSSRCITTTDRRTYWTAWYMRRTCCSAAPHAATLTSRPAWSRHWRKPKLLHTHTHTYAHLHIHTQQYSTVLSPAMRNTSVCLCRQSKTNWLLLPLTRAGIKRKVLALFSKDDQFPVQKSPNSC